MRPGTRDLEALTKVHRLVKGFTSPTAYAREWPQAHAGFLWTEPGAIIGKNFRKSYPRAPEPNRPTMDHWLRQANEAARDPNCALEFSQFDRHEWTKGEFLELVSLVSPSHVSKRAQVYIRRDLWPILESCQLHLAGVWPDMPCVVGTVGGEVVALIMPTRA